MRLRASPPAVERSVPTPGVIGSLLTSIGATVQQMIHHPRNDDTLLRETFDNVRQVISFLRSFHASIQQALNAVSTPADVFHGRASAARKSLIGALAVLCGGAAEMIELAQPETIPMVTHTEGFPTRATPIEKLPSPNEDIADVFRKLPHPADVAHFLQKHVQYEVPKDALEFLQTYRMAPARLLERRCGACNSFSEFTAQWAYARGMQPFIVRLRPSQFVPLHSYHELTTIRTRIDQWIVFDNQHFALVEGSLEEWLAVAHSDAVLLERGGLIPWTPTKDHWLPKFIRTVDANAADPVCNASFTLPTFGERIMISALLKEEILEDE
jgi:hypothetical protein